MVLFLLAYILIYGSMQAVFYLRLQPLLPDSSWVRLLICLFLVLMVAAPILSRLLEKADQILLASGAAWVGYSWMGFVFLAFCFGLALSLLEGALSLWSRFYGFETLKLSPKWSAGFLLLLCLGLSVYGVWESRQLRLERLRVETGKLPPGSSFSLVQISDVHLGFMLNKGTVQRIVRIIREIGPDMLVCTGDLVDRNLKGLRDLAPVLAGISPPLGAYAVTGNHETYAGLEASISFLEQAGFRTLRDEALQVSNPLVLAGMDYSRKRRCPVEDGLLDGINPEKFTILLKHSPEVCPHSPGRVDLQLSGHTHKGQIFPFNLVVGAFYSYVSGLHSTDEDSWIYVSRGTGTWGPRMRILAPPELTLIEVRGRNEPGKEGSPGRPRPN